MFYRTVALLSFCIHAFWNAGSMRVYEPVGTDVFESPMEGLPRVISSRDTSSNHAMAEVIVHIIGDTHGDNNYLLRCLESTKRVEIDLISGRLGVRWATGMSKDELWEIVILGDIVDIGVRSRENLLALKALTEDPNWGKRLVILLGNHESMLLQARFDYVSSQEPWSFAERMADLSAPAGSEAHSLISWLRERPVVYVSHGIVMMHGGLSARQAKEVANKSGCQRSCGHAMQAFINKKARRFYERLHQSYSRSTTFPFYLSSGDDTSDSDNASTLPDILSDYSRGEPMNAGIFSYNGFSDTKVGAGGTRKCREAEHVGAYFGSDSVMILAHTTHPRIKQYCKNFRVPIFAVDTHPSECSGQKPAECDFNFRHDFHPKYKEYDYEQTSHLPQSLKVTQRNLTREFAACYERKHEVHCRVLRNDTLVEVPSQAVVVPSDSRAPEQQLDPGEEGLSAQSPGPHQKRASVATTTNLVVELNPFKEGARLWNDSSTDENIPRVAKKARKLPVEVEEEPLPQKSSLPNKPAHMPINTGIHTTTNVPPGDEPFGDLLIWHPLPSSEDVPSDAKLLKQSFGVEKESLADFFGLLHKRAQTTGTVYPYLELEPLEDLLGSSDSSWTFDDVDPIIEAKASGGA